MQPIADTFERLGVRYYVGGSVASSARGVPRASIDVDLAAELRPEHVDPFVAASHGRYYSWSGSVPEARLPIGNGATSSASSAWPARRWTGPTSRAGRPSSGSPTCSTGPSPPLRAQRNASRRAGPARAALLPVDGRHRSGGRRARRGDAIRTSAHPVALNEKWRRSTLGWCTTAEAWAAHPELDRDVWSDGGGRHRSGFKSCGLPQSAEGLGRPFWEVGGGGPAGWGVSAGKITCATPGCVGAIRRVQGVGI